MKHSCGCSEVKKLKIDLIQYICSLDSNALRLFLKSQVNSNDYQFAYCQGYMDALKDIRKKLLT